MAAISYRMFILRFSIVWDLFVLTFPFSSPTEENWQGCIWRPFPPDFFWDNLVSKKYGTSLLQLVVHSCTWMSEGTFQRFMWRDLVSQGCRMYLHLIISVHKYWLIAQRLGPHCMCYSKSRYHDIFYSNRNPRFENFSSLQMALLWMLTYSQEERKKLHAYSTQYFPLLCYIMQTYDQRQPSPTECIGWRLSEILNILRRLASCISCYTLKCAVLKVYRVWALPLEKKIDWKRTLQSIRTSQRRYLRHPIDVI